MIKCPFCHFENEDGALFCERCTSDLAATAVPEPAEPPLIPEAPLVSDPPLIPEAPLVPEELLAPDTMPADAIPIAMAEPNESIPLAPIAPITPIDLAPIIPTSPIALEPVEQHVNVTPPPASSATPVIEGVLTPGAQPRLVVLRGQKRNVEYPLYEGLNFIGRADEKPVDIDLEDQEPPDRIWCSRQHACISFENDQLVLEDLNSANGTYVNRTRVYPNQKRQLNPNDIIQIGNVQLKVVV